MIVYLRTVDFSRDFEEFSPVEAISDLISLVPPLAP
jgi:hypothetical protein